MPKTLPIVVESLNHAGDLTQIGPSSTLIHFRSRVNLPNRFSFVTVLNKKRLFDSSEHLSLLDVLFLSVFFALANTAALPVNYSIVNVSIIHSRLSFF